MGISILIGIGVFILGFVISALSVGDASQDYSFYNGIIMSILYLASVVAISTSLILKEMKTKNKK
ncbi:permease [Oceanirhabdus sp. W0125-5]|uniref:permease n=1 Tax=Oceanirhabdus sp. W0125-5 TaxID=2999116 RepID=UPI0022F2F998|nr:permease [Oceanirhabdus sp. W0125-5]WBW97758.1 permease [Oceanirhabdus sp. W0125-5]